jgi:hypothetical protein
MNKTTFLRRLLGRDSADKPYEVSGQHRLFGSGVLVWCYDDNDASDVLKFLQSFRGFRNLRITQSGQETLLPF